VLTAPHTGRYIAGWPRENEADVPELTIGVVAACRGQGVGRALLRALAVRAVDAGIERVSLSVERTNFAQRLYLAEGYEVVAEGSPESDTVVKVLRKR
jgi:ribosomal protein S18 acetylase RimI-like enzyme